MKSYTDLEQSKKLLELGIDANTADMEYMFHRNDGKIVAPSPFIKDGFENTGEDRVFDFTPCWSLEALISLLPKRYCLETLDNGTYVCYNFLSQYEKFGKTPIDAVYSMIVFLKEEKII